MSEQRECPNCGDEDAFLVAHSCNESHYDVVHCGCFYERESHEVVEHVSRCASAPSKSDPMSCFICSAAVTGVFEAICDECIFLTAGFTTERRALRTPSDLLRVIAEALLRREQMRVILQDEGER